MPTCQKPKYLHLADTLRSQIQSGELKAGDRLPSLVQMYRDHGATQATMHRAYELLEKDNLIERRGGSGVYVVEPERELTGNIGFIGSDSHAERIIPFSTNIQEGIQQAIAKHEQHLLYLGTKDSWKGRRCEQVDGILICDIENPGTVLEMVPPGLPCVSMLKTVDGISSVTADDYHGAKTATKYLLSLGHRRIACLMEKLPSQARRRFSGYWDALLEEEVKLEDEWIRLTSSPSEGVHYLEWGKEQMRQWLRKGWSDLQCTALLVQNETSAIGVMQVLKEVGIKVPQEISVMGFDGTELCAYSTPTLCAMELPLREIGAKAVEVLNRQILEGTEDTSSIIFPLRIREGASVSPVKSTF
jgi:LacI family transcriptional regulator